MVTPGNPLKSVRELAPLSERIRLSEQVASDPRIKVTAFEASHHVRYTADTLAFSPPLIVKKADIDRIFGTVRKVLAELP
jgi:adenosylmethionine-8-amino-7-oxononanoate aminotransferase